MLSPTAADFYLLFMIQSGGHINNKLGTPRVFDRNVFNEDVEGFRFHELIVEATQLVYGDARRVCSVGRRKAPSSLRGY